MVILNLGRKEEQGVRLGKYELGKTLGEGNFGKVKLARDTHSGKLFAVKILDKSKIIDLNNIDQVLASKTKIYMVLEYVNGGELFDKIADGLLHTTCGSPNYVAPEILANKGYDGATSDIWSCGVILYVILTGYLPFDDRNLAVLYQKIFKGEVQIPRWLSPGSQNIIKRMLDANPKTRITMAMIKEDEWFKEGYTPANPEDEEESVYIDDEDFSIHDVSHEADQGCPRSPTLINAFQLISMSSSLDLSGLFEQEDVSERKIRFTSIHSPKDLVERIEDIVTEMGFRVQKKNGMLKVIQEIKVQKCPGSFSVEAEVFEISPSLYVVELSKSCGDASLYRQLCKKLSNDLGVHTRQQLGSSEVMA
ncbi:hypothetical protein JHK85_024940 [Glycine max]|nr:hypothetical protein JHK85_024940 [Glycine max]